MSQYPQQQSPSRPWELNYSQATDRTIFNFFSAVYAWMAVGLALTAAVAYGVANSPLINVIYGFGMGGLVLMFLVAFGISWYVQSQVGRISTGFATGLFLFYAAIWGVLCSFVFIVYPIATLGAAFLLTAGTFGAMSVYGYVTKRDLTGIGSIAVMAVFGVIIASIVNIFLANNAMSWIITYAILALFIIITAYETQQLKNMAYQFQGSPEMLARYAIVGSLVLYISFLNLFLSILRILGDRR
jgi:uncharacterized protein